MRERREKKLLPNARRKVEREAVRNRNNILSEAMKPMFGKIIIALGTMNDLFPVFDGEYRLNDFDKKARDKFLEEFKQINAEVSYDRKEKVYTIRRA
jgi:hypothetical protein